MILGEICHIHADSQLGPRYLASQSDIERQSFENLLLLCSEHHKLVDSPEMQSAYPANELRRFKAEHERSQSESTKPPFELSEDQIQELLASVERYAGDAVHMDFRNAMFRVGGEGGGFGGGGGSGGVLNIVGTTRLPHDAKLELNGEDGRDYGAGGGGAGAIRFEGRELEESDIAAGFCLSSFLGVSSWNYSNGMVNVLGAGWTYWRVESIPAELSMVFLGVYEIGALVADALIRSTVSIVGPSGSVVASVHEDVESRRVSDQVRRMFTVYRVPLTINEAGVHVATLTSGSRTLAEYRFEVRLAT